MEDGNRHPRRGRAAPGPLGRHTRLLSAESYSGVEDQLHRLNCNIEKQNENTKSFKFKILGISNIYGMENRNQPRRRNDTSPRRGDTHPWRENWRSENRSHHQSNGKLQNSSGFLIN